MYLRQVLGWQCRWDHNRPGCAGKEPAKTGCCHSSHCRRAHKTSPCQTSIALVRCSSVKSEAASACRNTVMCTPSRCLHSFNMTHHTATVHTQRLHGHLSALTDNRPVTGVCSFDSTTHEDGDCKPTCVLGRSGGWQSCDPAQWRAWVNLHSRATECGAASDQPSSVLWRPDHDGYGRGGCSGQDVYARLPPPIRR